MVQAGKKEAIVDLAIEVMYGFSIPQIIIEERRKIAARLLEFTGLVAKEVNVQVARIAFPEIEGSSDEQGEVLEECAVSVASG